jgi:regulator of RNase E activity RraA
MPKFLNNAGMTVSGTPGTGDVTLLAAITDATNGNYQTFANAGAVAGDVLTVRFVDGNAWEESDVIYAAGPSLTGRVLRQSSTGALISLTSAAKAFAVHGTRDQQNVMIFAHANLGGL